MPAPRNPYDRRHLRNLALYRQKVSLIFNIAASEAAMIGANIDSFDPSRPFSFADYPRAAYMMNELVRDFARDLDVQIIDGVEHEWNLANGKDDALVRSVFGDNLTPDMERRYFTTNEPAMDAFIKRKEGGMDLSERVWKYSDEFKSEIEMGIDIGLRDGLDARAMARDLQQYLRHPDMLFRRVRDEHGNLHLSQRAAAFHPGQGVYRSSYMNALRLTVTECNMAYRTADYLRWQQMDFVVGIEIELSNNHTCLDRNGVPQPFTDICDELKGRYPKEFKFVGWHPFCRCHATPVLKTDEELDKELEAALLDEPEPDTTHSDNEVTDVPDGFKQWLDTNAERIERAQHRGKLPYFLRDNEIVGSAATGYKWEPSVTQPTSVDIVAQRQRTQEQVEEIRKRWYTRQLDNLQKAVADNYLPMESNITIQELKDRLANGELDEVGKAIQPLRISAQRHASRTIDDIRRIQDAADARLYGQSFVDNIHEIEQKLGIKRGKRMSHEEANFGRVNPHYFEKGGDINCSTCSGTYYLRRLGFDVQAKVKIPSNVSVVALSRGYTTWDKWIDGQVRFTSTKDWMRGKGYKSMNKARYIEFINETCQEDGIYEWCIGWKGNDGGHSTLIMVKSGVPTLIDQQTTFHVTLERYASNARSRNLWGGRGIMRIDNASFNPQYADIVEPTLTVK